MYCMLTDKEEVRERAACQRTTGYGCALAQVLTDKENNRTVCFSVRVYFCRFFKASRLILHFDFQVKSNRGVLFLNGTC